MSASKCIGDHDYSVVREDERELGVWILCSRCGDYRLSVAPRTPIPDQVREGME